MTVKELFKGVNANINGVENLQITGIYSDSRKVLKGGIFFAIKGEKVNGEDFIEEALLNGASVIVSESQLKTNARVIVVKDCRKTLSKTASNFYNFKKLKIIGIVGTNGKTTTSYLLKSILEEGGYKVGVIGTNGILYDNVFIEQGLTTPDILELSYTLYNMQRKGVDFCVMEVSAHAISLDRVYGIKFNQLIFTNISQDHLDYYSSFDEYANVKLSIFNKNQAKSFIVNSDDAYGVKILNKELQNTFSYGIYNPSDVFALDINTSLKGSSFVVNAFDDIAILTTNLVGEFNVYNLLSSITSANIIGVSLQTVKRAMLNFKGVLGRLEYIESYNGGSVYIDYAHTPDGVENVLKTLKKECKGKLITVFGCGGNRDKSKRKQMGKIAGQIADFTVITTDNPRFEEPFSIIKQIEEGLREVSLKYITIENRYLATGYAISSLKKGDVLVVLGKGAEEYQEIMGVKTKYSDKESIKEIIAKLDFCGDLI